MADTNAIAQHFFNMKNHTETIAAANHTYTVHMGGTCDGANTRDPVGYSPYTQGFEPNHFVRLENIGDTDVVNPWIIVNGKRDWRSIDHILAEILRPDMTDAEKAHAIWDFARTHRYHYTCADDEVKDTVKMLNSYGYTLCWDEAYTVSNLWQAAGLAVRRGYPHGHCTTEVYYDGAYHLLDSDEHLCYLLRDNRTVASEEDLSRDHDLVKRGHAYGMLLDENRRRAEGAASLFFHTGPRTGGRPCIGTHTMDLTLRPNETLVWEWADRNKYHGYWDRPKRLANGRMHYAPDLAHASKWAEHLDNFAFANGALRPERPGKASLSLALRSPYVIVGGRLTLHATESTGLTVDLSRDGQTWHPVSQENEDGAIACDLDSHFAPDTPASYTYILRLNVQTAVAIQTLAVETDLQMAPLSLPALEIGDNRIRYTAQNEGRVRITHAWEERTATPPEPPSQPTFPKDGARVDGTQFTFAWPEVEAATDYHIQLSPHADMRAALSPNFEKLVSRTPSKGKSEWRISEEGMLNPDQPYYWRVRPRNADGLWGDWSPTWSFTPGAPGVPLNVEIHSDFDARTLTLRWQPNPEGNAPEHYEIYGSDERGFTVNRTPYEAVTGNDKTDTFPANQLTTTHQTAIEIGGPGIGHKNCAYYRVIAVDAKGIRSGPSDMAEAPRPMIVSKPAEHARAETVYTYHIKTIAAIGELRCESDGTQRYRSAFRDGDTLRFLLDEGPNWIHLDEHTGELTARPRLQDVGTHTVTVRVQNGQGGQDMQGFDLQVVP